MLNLEWVKKTEAFLKEKFENAVYLNEHPEAKTYRIEHTYRVANIGREIAVKEGFDETEIIACLLHDVAYCEEFGEDGWKEHGRRSARIARPFLKELGIPEDRANDICYGIAIHVDETADFPGENTPFALSIGDADNIDRFDAYRIHETLNQDAFLEMRFEDKTDYLEKRLLRLRALRELPFGTKTAEALWRSRIDFYTVFIQKLADQMKQSKGVTGSR
ncbi:MAG: HD domain-containing protein [Clostridia bacterium]|nr:HD domain-containing protein [Clostridia bacterium]MBR3195800.1 HD domain-containing protein [Clostridia bacterium]